MKANCWGIATAFALALLLVGSVLNLTPAYGHGGGGDMVMASIGDRQVTLRVDMKPSLLLAEAPQDATIQLRLFDSATDKNIEHVTYFITVKKDDRALMREWFHAHDGNLFIKIRPTERDGTIVNGPQEPILNGFLGSVDSPALAQGPIFLEGGLYTFNVEIFSIDFDKTLLDPPIKFDAFVSIGETVTYSTDGGEEITIRTFYDKINDFNLDEENKIIKFSMPLNWDKQYLSQVPLVHEEVVIPRSFSELIADKYSAAINGVELPDNAVMVDDASPDEVVVHYMVRNDQLLKLADHVSVMGTSKNMAEFELAPGEVELGMPLEEGGIGSQMMAMSSKGSIHMMFSWSPTMIEPGKVTSFAISFTDAKSGATMRDVTYDFVLLKDGQEIIRRQGQSVSGVANEQFTFKESQAGAVTLRLENIGNTGESVDFNIQVVPEFPIGAVIAMAGAVAAVLIFTRIKLISNRIKI